MKKYFDPIKEAEKTIEWIKTPEGKRKLEEAIKEGEEYARRFKEASRIDYSDPRLYEPMTI